MEEWLITPTPTSGTDDPVMNEVAATISSDPASFKLVRSDRSSPSAMVVDTSEVGAQRLRSMFEGRIVVSRNSVLGDPRTTPSLPF